MGFLFFLGFNGFCGGRWLWWWFCFQFFVLQWIVAATMAVAAVAVLWLLITVLDILFYCVVYIILMCSKYYFNV